MMWTAQWCAETARLGQVSSLLLWCYKILLAVLPLNGQLLDYDTLHPSESTGNTEDAQLHGSTKLGCNSVHPASNAPCFETSFPRPGQMLQEKLSQLTLWQCKKVFLCRLTFCKGNLFMSSYILKLEIDITITESSCCLSCFVTTALWICSPSPPFTTQLKAYILSKQSCSSRRLFSAWSLALGISSRAPKYHNTTHLEMASGSEDLGNSIA